MWRAGRKKKGRRHVGKRFLNPDVSPLRWGKKINAKEEKEGGDLESPFEGSQEKRCRGKEKRRLGEFFKAREGLR